MLDTVAVNGNLKSWEIFYQNHVAERFKVMYQVVLTLARKQQMLDAVGVNGYLKRLEILY